MPHAANERDSVSRSSQMTLTEGDITRPGTSEQGDSEYQHTSNGYFEGHQNNLTLRVKSTCKGVSPLKMHSDHRNGSNGFLSQNGSAEDCCQKETNGYTSENGNVAEDQEGSYCSKEHNTCDKGKLLVFPPKHLLTIKDVPQHLQFNPYIVTGYRPMCTFWGSVQSLFYLHNETVNIITHGVPIIYILLVVPSVVPWDRMDRYGRFLAWCHLVGSVAPWIGSFVYHLFMNLQAGERVYNRLLKLDMFGIWICQSFGALPMVSATVYCLPWTVRWFVIMAYCALSLSGLYKAMTALSPWKRRLSFALPWVNRLVLCVVRATLGGGHPDNMMHLILQDTVSGIGGVVGAVYFPEKYFPGWMDYILNSHNIMHVLVVAAVYSMHCATMLDLQWMSSVQCRPHGPPEALNIFASLLSPSSKGEL